MSPISKPNTSSIRKSAKQQIARKQIQQALSMENKSKEENIDVSRFLV
jgi:hypothetical protein